MRSLLNFLSLLLHVKYKEFLTNPLEIDTINLQSLLTFGCSEQQGMAAGKGQKTVVMEGDIALFLFSLITS